MAIELKGMDGKYHTFASIDIYRKHKNDSDLSETVCMLLASIGNELENIVDLIEPELKD
mgnify:CR=1 FL=1|jgi:hypothetical protein|tara:strand:- start:112 stop:288 length:177 start_codon:yes stop_codon:yes gene_type:complete